MADDLRALEPFPLFIDSAPPESANYFSSKMGSLHLLTHTSPSQLHKPGISMPTKLTNYLRLRYYQYEVTFGLYVMTSAEKLVLNTIVLAIFGALLYALYWGLEPFVAHSLCRLIYYITGSYPIAEERCAP